MTNPLNIACLWGVVAIAIAGSGCSHSYGNSLDSQHSQTGQQTAPERSSQISELETQLDSSSMLIRRRAIRQLARLIPEASDSLIKAQKNSDYLVRRTALRALCSMPNANPIKFLTLAFNDSHPLVRLASVELLGQIKPRTDDVASLLMQGRTDQSESVCAAANKALWPFYRKNISIRDRGDYDYEVEVAATLKLPKTGWRFSLDPQQGGHLKNWHGQEFDDSHWDEIEIENAWQNFGYDYIGVAWYRGWVDFPEKPSHVAVEIAFGGVDENAWVWINGKYIGQHVIGPRGWDQPFRLDISKEILWGQKNQMTVRAMNTTDAGGIWRPVEIEILK